jgi:ABC-2 type transport system permease protein
MRKLFAIIRHEFRLAAANKVFIAMTILGPFLLLAVTALPMLLATNPSVMSGGKPIAVASADPAVQEAVRAVAGQQGRDLWIVGADADALAAAKAQVLKDEATALVVAAPGWEDGGIQLFSATGTDYLLFGGVEGALTGIARQRRVERSGIDPALAAELTRGIGFNVVKLSAGEGEKAAGEAEYMQTFIIAMSFVMLVYMTTILYGQLIGRSVVMEKTSKTVEVMLSSVSARELMFGKIFGLGLAGMLQYSIWVSVAVLLTKLVGPVLRIAPPAAMSIANLAWLVVFFVLAFFLYASGYAAIGAAAEDEHHMANLSWPLLIFLMVPLMMISSIIMNPGSPVAVAMSLFPMTSPIVMLIRLLIAPPPLWQIALCLVLLVGTVYAMAVGAAKIFRTGILMTGKRISFGEMLKWLGQR